VERGADPEHIARRAKVYAMECAARGQRIPANAARWLNESYYNDPMPEGLVINELGEPVEVPTNKPKGQMTGSEAGAEWIRRYCNADSSFH
jgi:hypothetical protein